MLSVFLAFTSEKLRQGLSLAFRAAGLPLGEVHGTGAAIIRAVRQRGGGLVLCGERLTDMAPGQLHDALGDDALVVVLQRYPSPLCYEDSDMKRLVMPPSSRDLASQVRQLLQAEELRQRRRRQPRTQQEEELIQNAKQCLMTRLGIPEHDAHRMLQQASMRQGQRMAQIAERILQV
ncbi:MAG TPA: ANTAR domain-containing protein [Clostridia bacterium]|nr:ANTAR domain-containing protein [Clostridia bacterium]